MMYYLMNYDDLYSGNHALLKASTISLNPALRAAPPTKNPSISDYLASSGAFFSVTDPPYMILVYAETLFHLEENNYITSVET